jgi:hypothetical protein
MLPRKGQAGARPFRYAPVCYILSLEKDSSRMGPVTVQSHYRIGETGFSGTVSPEDTRHLTGPDLNGDILEDISASACH